MLQELRCLLQRKGLKSETGICACHFITENLRPHVIVFSPVNQAAAAHANTTAKMVVDRVSHKTKIDVFENAFRKIKEVCLGLENEWVALCLSEWVK